MFLLPVEGEGAFNNLFQRIEFKELINNVFLRSSLNPLENDETSLPPSIASRVFHLVTQENWENPRKGVLLLTLNSI